jgi:hypothetical protein
MPVNKTQIRSLLLESAFDPKIPGPLASILESSDPKYLMQRAVEMIRSAQLPGAKINDIRNNIKVALSLLAMARALSEPAEVKAKKKKSEVPKNIDQLMNHSYDSASGRMVNAFPADSLRPNDRHGQVPDGTTKNSK